MVYGAMKAVTASMQKCVYLLKDFNHDDEESYLYCFVRYYDPDAIVRMRYVEPRRTAKCADGYI